MESSILQWLKVSNHWKHLLGGFAVGIPCGIWLAVYVAAVAASCLEYKDRAKGGRWDWADWWLTVGGGFAASLVWVILRAAA